MIYRIVFFLRVIFSVTLLWFDNFTLDYQLSVGCLQYNFVTVFDCQSKFGLVLVIFISFLVFTFSIDYISGDTNVINFQKLLAMFVFSIILLLLGGRITFFLIGWDALGITSFLLILYYNRIGNVRSRLVTYTVNRFGDSLLIACIFFYGYQGNLLIISFVSRMGFFYTIAAITKSAGYPLRVWLPLAMDAPTPVRALVHRRTLVTAGLFLLARFNFDTLPMLTFIGRVTFLIGAATACYSQDVKKIIACSTLAHLGLMIVSLRLAQIELILFHLATHALFKSGLFILAGTCLIRRYGIQDIRHLRPTGDGFFKILATYFCIASLSIFPFSTRFSKHTIINRIQIENLNPVVPLLLILSTLLSIMYRLRLLRIFLVRGKLGIRGEVPDKTLFVLLLAAVVSIIFGNFFQSSNLLAYSFESFSVPIFLCLLIGFLISYQASKFLSRFAYMDQIFDNFVGIFKGKQAQFWLVKW